MLYKSINFTDKFLQNSRCHINFSQEFKLTKQYEKIILEEYRNLFCRKGIMENYF